MRLSPIAITLAAAAMLPAAAQAKDAKPAAAKSAEPYIAFVNHGGLRDWRSDDRDTVYFQDNQRHWYKAKLFAPASDLPFAQAIGIDSSPTDRLDKWSSVIIRGHRYALRSFERISGEPPKKAKKAQGRKAGLINSPG
jgi:hypothetical protein